VGAPSVYCCGGGEEFKGGDGEGEINGEATAALPHAVAPVGAPSERVLGLQHAKRAAAAPGSLREATTRRKRTATRLLRWRTRWRCGSATACIGAG
jgi:hypothetical protein